MTLCGGELFIEQEIHYRGLQFSFQVDDSDDERDPFESNNVTVNSDMSNNVTIDSDMSSNVTGK